MGQTVLITGATSGIGQATAKVFAEEGYNIIITGRRYERLRHMKKCLEEIFNIQVLALCFDIRDRQQCEAAIGTLPGEFRNIDILVNNAGLAAGLEHIHEADPNDWDAMIDTNVKGLLYITRKVSSMMVERGVGHIINIGSIAGTQPYERGSAYCASKHAVHALSQSMRIDLLKHGIKVTEVRPGMTDTEFSLVRFHGDEERAADVYNGVTPLSSDDVAEVILWAALQPPHVNIDEVVVTPTQQANVYYTHRKE